jgi:predicted ribosome quality control (RQC) complex YloA/Tae2 family protein
MDYSSDLIKNWKRNLKNLNSQELDKLEKEIESKYNQAIKNVESGDKVMKYLKLIHAQLLAVKSQKALVSSMKFRFGSRRSSPRSPGRRRTRSRSPRRRN